MENTPTDVLQGDTYHVWVPIEDTDLLKSVQVDENGDYIVQGVMTSDEVDEENDSIDPEGMDCSYFLTKGWIKYEHGNNPNQFIGEPLEVKVGRFEHPTLKKAVNGIFVKGRLFANRELARQAVRAIQDLQKSNTKRRMGWSIEGNVRERCRRTGKILKSVLRNVVLTMNPVNTMTWAELAKSFAKNHEVEVNMELDKSMDTGAIAELMPQSIEGYDPEKDPQEKWIKLFRKFVAENGLKKSLRDRFVTSTSGEAGIGAYQFARREGLDYEGAVEFASYIADRHEILKSLFGKFGGENMEKNASTLASLLDTDLEELKKSLELDEEDDLELEEELNKSMDGDQDSDDSEDEDDAEDEDTEEDDSDEDEDEDGDSDEDEEVEKSYKTELTKSLAKEHGQAFEVSDFLTALTDEIGFGLEGLQKSLGHVTKQQNAIVKTLASMGELVKSLAGELQQVRAENAELRKSLGDVLERPVGRKSVVNQREVTTLTKSMGAGQPLTRAQVEDVLVKSFEAGELNGSEVIRWNAGVPLEQLNLPDSVKSKLGLL